ncbi:hypothetical protein EP331_12530 [bacterium]|nr:MAG: hypothetical protein EP331_12530 [bacterium]
MIQILKIAAVVISITFLHLAFEWLVPLVAAFLFVGLILDEYIVLTVTITGTLVNGIPTLISYFMYANSATKITEDLSIILGNIDATIVLLISLLIPTIMYAIAGVFAWQISEIRRKLTA